MIVFDYSTIYLLTHRNGLYLHVDGIFVALAPSKYRNLDLCQGVVVCVCVCVCVCVGGGGGGGGHR